jgi:hypothetical protein
VERWKAKLGRGTGEGYGAGGDRALKDSMPRAAVSGDSSSGSSSSTIIAGDSHANSVRGRRPKASAKTATTTYTTTTATSAGDSLGSGVSEGAARVTSAARRRGAKQ